jgi:hypothetical protein
MPGVFILLLFERDRRPQPSFRTIPTAARGAAFSGEGTNFGSKPFVFSARDFWDGAETNGECWIRLPRQIKAMFPLAIHQPFEHQSKSRLGTTSPQPAAVRVEEFMRLVSSGGAMPGNDSPRATRNLQSDTGTGGSLSRPARHWRPSACWPCQPVRLRRCRSKELGEGRTDAGRWPGCGAPGACGALARVRASAEDRDVLKKLPPARLEIHRSGDLDCRAPTLLYDTVWFMKKPEQLPIKTRAEASKALGPRVRSDDCLRVAIIEKHRQSTIGRTGNGVQRPRRGDVHRVVREAEGTK